jgi:hypothetical protein
MSRARSLSARPSSLGESFLSSLRRATIISVNGLVSDAMFVRVAGVKRTPSSLLAKPNDRSTRDFRVARALPLYLCKCR